MFVYRCLVPKFPEQKNPDETWGALLLLVGLVPGVADMVTLVATRGVVNLPGLILQ